MPSRFVIVSRDSPVERETTETFAFVMTAPLESLMVPFSVAVSTCANPGLIDTIASSADAQNSRRDIVANFKVASSVFAPNKQEGGNEA